MPESRGFIDLRIGHGAGGIGDESIWPSFTDIMAVIVMIFMMALVIIMVRNFELNRELVSTISAKEATTLAREKLAEELTELSGLLEDAENRGALLQADLETGLERLASLTAEYTLLESEHEAVVSKREQLEQENLGLEADQKASLVEIVKLNTNALALNQQIETLSQQLATLQVQSDEQIASLTAEKQGLGEKLDTVSGQVAELKRIEVALNQQIETLSRRIATLQVQSDEQIASLTAEKQDLGEKLDTVSGQAAELKRIEVALNRQIETLSQQLATLQVQSDEQIASLSAEKQDLGEKLDTVSGQVAELKRIEVALNQQIEKLSQQFVTLAMESGEQITSISAQKSSLNEKLDIVSRQLSELRVQLSQAQSENQELTQEVGELRTGNIDAEQRYLVASKDIQELEELIRRRESEKASLEADQKASLVKIDDLNANAQALNQRIEKLSQQFVALAIESGEQITSISEEKRSLSENLDIVSGQLDELKTQLAQAQSENQELVREVGVLQTGRVDAEQRYTTASEDIRELEELIRRRESENADLEARSTSSNQQFESLQDEYNRLTEEYRRLIRAARSPAGKYVVEVRLEKSTTGFIYQMREPGDSNPVVVTKAQLEQKLQAIKADKGKSLYTRIVIPRDNRLTHNEAWQFTWEILQKYDYYYQ